MIKKFEQRITDDRDEAQYNIDVHNQSREYIVDFGDYSLNLPFQPIRWGHFRARKGFFVDCWKCKQYMLLLSVTGNGKITYKGKTYPLEANNIVLINYELRHYYAAAEDNHWEYIFVQFCGSSMPTYEQLINEEGLTVISTQSDKKLSSLIFGMEALFAEDGISSRLAFSEGISEILTYMAAKAQQGQDQVRCQVNDTIRRVFDYIFGHYSEKITIEQLSEVACFSKYHFMHVFKRIVGITPYEYITCYRISRAKQLLRERDLMTLDQIATMTGLGDSRNLIRTFKKLNGITPTQFRNFEKEII